MSERNERLNRFDVRFTRGCSTDIRSCLHIKQLAFHSRDTCMQIEVGVGLTGVNVHMYRLLPRLIFMYS